VRLAASPLLADGMKTGCGPLAQAGGFFARVDADAAQAQRSGE
jgi:hypothetical protein